MPRTISPTKQRLLDRRNALDALDRATTELVHASTALILADDFANAQDIQKLRDKVRVTRYLVSIGTGVAK